MLASYFSGEVVMGAVVFLGERHLACAEHPVAISLTMALAFDWQERVSGSVWEGNIQLI
jgi:hypothetical protein